VQGTITGIKKKTFDDGSIAAQLFIRKPDGAEVCLTAGQARLKAILSQERPAVGDEVWIKYSGDQKQPGKPAPLKLFEVRVKRGPGPADTRGGVASIHGRGDDDKPPF
jgi:hypothetical protein